MAKPSGSKAALRLKSNARAATRGDHAQNAGAGTKAKVLPTVIEAQEEQRRALAKHRAASAGRAISPYTLGGGGRRTRARGTQTPSRQRYAAQVKTMALLIALAIIFTLLWRVVPAS